MPIKILPANPNWPTQFSIIKASLEIAIPEGGLIHHIGSTAVPNLVAKNIIDIQISLDSLEDLDTEAMSAAGCNPGRSFFDHCPPGMSLQQDELAKLVFRCNEPFTANIHVREKGRFNQRYALLCRDYLRTHPLAAAAYGTIKQQLASHFPTDQDAYYDIKDPVFDLLMAGAEDWAVSTSWVQPEPD